MNLRDTLQLQGLRSLRADCEVLLEMIRAELQQAISFRKNNFDRAAEEMMLMRVVAGAIGFPRNMMPVEHPSLAHFKRVRRAVTRQAIYRATWLAGLHQGLIIAVLDGRLAAEDTLARTRVGPFSAGELEFAFARQVAEHCTYDWGTPNADAAPADDPLVDDRGLAYLQNALAVTPDKAVDSMRIFFRCATDYSGAEGQRIAYMVEGTLELKRRKRYPCPASTRPRDRRAHHARLDGLTTIHTHPLAHTWFSVALRNTRALALSA